jgi:DNA-binding transcriptional MerR regulator
MTGHDDQQQSDRTWKVGALAKVTGLTVRTLHHYEIGLLRPSARG